MHKTGKPESGFSLLEIMVVLLILMVVMGIVFNAVGQVQKRYRTEEERVDTMQNAREFVDQISRDLRNAGYPNAKMFTTTPAATDRAYATGLVAASGTAIIFEGDLDNTGSPVKSVQYQLQADANGNCPCTLRRSSVDKDGTNQPENMSTNWSAEVENLVNSTGNASAYSITGSTPSGSSNDTVYASYKTLPVFEFFDAAGNAVAVPDTLSGSNKATGVSAAASVALITVNVNIMGPNADIDTGRRPVATMRTTVKLPNK
jgi:Tfp pilus assembly protein PilW